MIITVVVQQNQFNANKVHVTLTNDPVQSKRQEICNNATHMSTKRVSNTGEPIGTEACSAEEPQGICSAARHRPQIVYCRDVAWRLTEIAPVQHEHVVASTTDVG